MADISMQQDSDGTWFPVDSDGSAYARSSWSQDQLESLRGLLRYNYKLVELREILPGKLLPIFKAPGRTAGDRFKRVWLSEEEWKVIVKLRGGQEDAATRDNDPARTRGMAVRLGPGKVSRSRPNGGDA